VDRAARSEHRNSNSNSPRSNILSGVLKEKSLSFQNNGRDSKQKNTFKNLVESQNIRTFAAAFRKIRSI